MATNLNADGVYPCIQVATTLENAFLRHPGSAPTSAGSYEALTSEINRSAFIQEQSVNTSAARPTDTSNRVVQVTYVPASCDEDLDFDKCDLDSNAAPSFLKANLTADLSHGWGFDLNENQYRDMCEGDVNGVYSRMLLAKYQQAKKQLNAKISAVIATLPGNYPTNGDDSITSPITLPVINSAGVFNSTAWGLLQSIWNAADITLQPINIVGGGLIDQAMNTYPYTVPTQLGVGVTGMPVTFRDSTIDAAFNDGSNHIVSFVPGAIQLLEWYENFGSYGWRKDMSRNGVTVAESERRVIVTPDGLSWDFYYEFDCDTHKFRFKKFFGVAPMPSDAFGECRDYNYILNFLAGCGDNECSDFDGLKPAIIPSGIIPS